MVLLKFLRVCVPAEKIREYRRVRFYKRKRFAAGIYHGTWCGYIRYSNRELQTNPTLIITPSHQHAYIVKYINR